MDPENTLYCLPSNYQSRKEPDYYDDTSSAAESLVWQPQVYHYARDLARACSLTRVIDVGCGTAKKLAGLAPEFRIVGVDYGPNLDECRRVYPEGTWIAGDFEKEDPLPVPKEFLEDSVIICSDVIEHLVRPEVLMKNLLLLLADAPFLILSTPDRYLVRGLIHRGPPPNPHHVREWTFFELRRFLLHTGFSILDSGWTQSVDSGPFCGTLLFVLGDRNRRDFNPQLSYRHRNLLRRNMDALKNAYYRRISRKQNRP